MKCDCRHWDAIFSNTEDSKLGWYEKDTSKTFALLKKIPGWDKASVFLPGAGTSVLIEDLLSREVRLIVNDISSEALNRVRQRLEDHSRICGWLCQDIARPIPEPVPAADIWIDRAVLHFLTDEEDINGYFQNVRSVLRVGGHAVFAEFSLTGAPRCAGLVLHRYSVDELAQRLGPSFEMIDQFDHTYINPFGDPRPYIYALFKRV